MRIATQTILQDTNWMFCPDPSTYYDTRFDFVYFNEKDELLYYDIEGNLIKKDNIAIDNNGQIRIIKGHGLRIIERVANNKIDFICKDPTTIEDDNVEQQEHRLEFVKMTPSIVDVTPSQLDRIVENSEWEILIRSHNPDIVQNIGCGIDKKLKISKWNRAHVEKKINRRREAILMFKKLKKQYDNTEEIFNIYENLRSDILMDIVERHVIKFKNTLLMIEQSHNLALSMVVIKKITQNKMVLVNHLSQNEEITALRTN